MRRDRLDIWLIALALFCSMIVTAHVVAQGVGCDTKCRYGIMVAQVDAVPAVTNCYEYAEYDCLLCGPPDYCLVLRPPGKGKCTKDGTEDQYIRSTGASNCQPNCPLVANVRVDAWWLSEPTEEWIACERKQKVCVDGPAGGGDEVLP